MDQHLETCSTTPSSKKEGAKERLERLGFKRVASKVDFLAKKRKKLAIAYEHYRYVTAEKMAAFQEKLKMESVSKNKMRWKQLAFTPLDSYGEVPPTHVLDSLETAMERGCFDSFAIAHIVEVKDPILFGYVHGGTDHFFIDQWDDDVKISDILKDNEG